MALCGQMKFGHSTVYIELLYRWNNRLFRIATPLIANNRTKLITIQFLQWCSACHQDLPGARPAQLGIGYFLEWLRRSNKFGNIVFKKNFMFFASVVASRSNSPGMLLYFGSIIWSSCDIRNKKFCGYCRKLTRVAYTEVCVNNSKLHYSVCQP